MAASGQREAHLVSHSAIAMASPAGSRRAWGAGSPRAPACIGRCWPWPSYTCRESDRGARSESAIHLQKSAIRRSPVSQTEGTGFFSVGGVATWSLEGNQWWHAMEKKSCCRQVRVARGHLTVPPRLPQDVRGTPTAIVRERESVGSSAGITSHLRSSNRHNNFTPCAIVNQQSILEESFLISRCFVSCKYCFSQFAEFGHGLLT